MADQADSPDASPMRGRATEYETVLSLLAGTAEGQGNILLVEGDPGTGKSLLLAAAAREARERGFSLVTAAADELSQATPLAPLLSAVHATATEAPSVGTVFTRLEGLATAGAVLVIVDDVQWADQATMHAFRSLPRLLASYPLSWILAMARSPHPGSAELLFDQLQDEGATPIILGPLDPAAQIALISDVLSAVPDTALVELAVGAAGNPFILAEAFGGLLDEDAITFPQARHQVTRRADAHRAGARRGRAGGRFVILRPLVQSCLYLVAARSGGRAGVEGRPADLGPPRVLVGGVLTADEVVLPDRAVHLQRVACHVGG
jgi:predicted ATPase